MSVDISVLQDQLFTWIRVSKNCSVSQLMAACQKLVEPYRDELPYSSNPIYWLAIPLLRLGILEYAIDKDDGVIIFDARKMRFILPNGKAIQANDEKNIARFHIVNDSHREAVQEFHPKNLLQSLPSIHAMVEMFPAYNTVVDAFDFSRNLTTLKIEPNTRKSENVVGLYKQKDLAYLPYCLILKDGTKKKVLLMQDSIDALYIASCYVLVENFNPIFFYNQRNKKLSVRFPFLLPIFISRALIQFAPEELLDPSVYEKEKYCYDNVPLQAVLELRRIFSYESVEVLYDKSY